MSASGGGGSSALVISRVSVSLDFVGLLDYITRAITLTEPLFVSFNVSSSYVFSSSEEQAENGPQNREL